MGEVSRWAAARDGLGNVVVVVGVGGTRPETVCAVVVPDDDVGACNMRKGLVASACSPPPPKDAAVVGCVVMNVALLGLVVALGGESW